MLASEADGSNLDRRDDSGGEAATTSSTTLAFAADRGAVVPMRRRRRMSAAHSAAILQACAMIEAAETMPALRDLARATRLSPFHFHRLFKAGLGITPHDYAAALRLARLEAALSRGAEIAQAIYEAGYGSSSRVYGRAADLLGMTPAQFKSGGAGLVVRFAVLSTANDWLLVAATSRGVCMIGTDTEAERLGAALAARFPRARRESGDAAFDAWIARALAQAPVRDTALPAAIREIAWRHRLRAALHASFADIAAGRDTLPPHVAA